MEKDLNATWGPEGSGLALVAAEHSKGYRRLRKELKQYELYRKTLENNKLKCKVWALQEGNLKLIKENLSRKGAKTHCLLALKEQVAALQDTYFQQEQTLQELIRQFNKNKDNGRTGKLKKLFTFSNGEQESCSEIDIFDPEACAQPDPQLLEQISQIEHRLKQLNYKLSKY